ncbi:hypothetical protein PoB_004363300 [Plakobranchus ocellatus]|uniref:Uncharacterized protein n=1 Tax=Plakobranchus ocellatus TaxID=259542 RepID=A0AAV4BE49_9GAST|nr:hypothetical protein PoB_004363300 [Plakobranchus ocellatus]
MQGFDKTVDSDLGLRSTGILLLQVQTLSPTPWPGGRSQSLRSSCCGLAMYKNSQIKLLHTFMTSCANCYGHQLTLSLDKPRNDLRNFLHEKPASPLTSLRQPQSATAHESSQTWGKRPLKLKRARKALLALSSDQRLQPTDSPGHVRVTKA